MSALPQDPITAAFCAALQVALEPLRAEIRALRAHDQPRVDDDLLTIKEAAKVSRRSVPSVRRLISTGRLRATRAGARGRIFIPRSAIRELITKGEL